MASYSVTTDLPAERVVAEAVDFFGSGGRGLEVEQQASCCAFFRGPSGFVSVETRENGETHVDVKTRHWDDSVVAFIRRVG
jgi:hypothetical protein